jgi:colanic acid biosynthesis glycosyl transferase WcaI
LHCETRISKLSSVVNSSHRKTRSNLNFDGNAGQRSLVGNSQQAMRILILTQYYPPEIGAPQARLSDLAAHFVQRGHSVTVLTAMPNYPTGKIHYGYGGLVRRQQEDGVNIIRTFIYPTQSPKFVQRLTNYLSFVLSSAALGGFMVQQADFVVVESPPLFLGLSGLYLTRLKKARMIFNVSDLWPQGALELGAIRAGSFVHKAAEVLEALCYRHAWLVTGQSKGILESVAKRFPACPTFHLSNGVNIQRFDPQQPAEDFRYLLNGRGKFVALYAGLHGIPQGLDQILDAAESLRDDAEIHFVLVGDGAQKKLLMEQATKRRLANVHFLDPRPAHEIPRLLAAADIALVSLKTYLQGAVPSKLYEAMASGRPVVLIAGGEAADIVRENLAGMVVAPGEIKSLAEAVRTLRHRPDLRRAFGENGRRAAQQYFDRAVIATRFIDHLEANL